MNNQELRIELLLEDVVKKRASDLHIQVGLPPMLRIDGRLMPVAGTMPLDEAAVERLVFQILDEDQRQILLKDKEFDFSFGSCAASDSQRNQISYRTWYATNRQ